MRYVLAVLVCLSTAPAPAADFSDPGWPCIQRKVERLSPGLMWPMEPGTASEDDGAGLGDAIDTLAATLALRRLDEDQLRAAVTDFSTRHPQAPSIMDAVFLSVFDRMSARRREIMAGIEDYSLTQRDLAARIDAARTEMETEMAQDAPDFDRVDALEEQIAWDERIYTDRQKSLTYVCETPQLLEKRLYTIAQILQQAAE